MADILSQHKVCCHAYMHVLNIGAVKWGRICNAAKEGKAPPQHGLAGRVSNRALVNKNVLDELRVFFDGLEDYAEP